MKIFYVKAIGGGSKLFFSPCNMLKVYISSYQKVVILCLEMPGSKVMTENVRQGFHHRPKSLIFPMGIFRTRKMHKIECLEPPSGPNGLKFSTHVSEIV